MPVALITGVTGQDGSYLAESLLEQGYRVHGVVRPNTPPEHLHVLSDDLTLHELDLTSLDELDELIAEVAPDQLYNLAAISSVFQSWQDPIGTTLINAIPVAQILESAWRLQEKSGRQVRVLQASSAELFGQSPDSPQTEQTRVHPSSPYGAAKAYAHHMVGVYRARGLFAASCILYNHESSRRPETFVTRKITSGAARIATGLQTSIQLGSLDVRRDWGWAPDYARAMSLALAASTADDYIIATGRTHTIADFLEIAFRHAGIDDWASYVSIDPAFSRPVDPVEQVGDASKARKVLGWAPTKTFEELVVDMVETDLRIARAELRTKE
jgi:GDPmannose 4,6-dehydratase